MNLLFKREFSYYLIQIYIPCCMLVIVSWVSFWLDANAVPARVSLGVTTLLTMATQTTGINNSLPPVSYTKVWETASRMYRVKVDGKCVTERLLGTKTFVGVPALDRQTLMIHLQLDPGHWRVDGRLLDVRLRSAAGVRTGQLRVALRCPQRETEETAAPMGNGARTGTPSRVRSRRRRFGPSQW